MIDEIARDVDPGVLWWIFWPAVLIVAAGVALIIAAAVTVATERRMVERARREATRRVEESWVVVRAGQVIATRGPVEFDDVPLAKIRDDA